jgi:hypothetical protein
VHHHGMLLEAESYAPDLVLFLMGINDWNQAIVDHVTDHYPPVRPSPLALLGAVSVQHTVVYQAIQLAWRRTVSLADRWGIDPPVIDEDGREVRSQAPSLERPTRIAFRPDTVSEGYAAWVGAIMAECQARALHCVFIDQPTAYHPDITPDLRRRLWMTPPNTTYTLPFDDISRLAGIYNEWLAKAAKDEGFRFCAIAGRIPPTTDYFFDDCHYNSNGSRRVARLVGDCLADEAF